MNCPSKIGIIHACVRMQRQRHYMWRLEIVLTIFRTTLQVAYSIMSPLRQLKISFVK